MIRNKNATSFRKWLSNESHFSRTLLKPFPTGFSERTNSALKTPPVRDAIKFECVSIGVSAPIFFLYFIFNPLDGFQTIENSRICSRISNTAVRAIGAGHALKAKCRPVSTSIRITRITLNVHRPSTEYVNTTRLAHVNWFCVYGFDFRTIWLFYACLKIHWYVRFRALLVNFIRFLFVWTILHIKYSTGNKFWFINFFTMKYESKKRFYDCI